MPKVSVIVPTYNVEMYLDQCMESLQRQTLKDIEIVCVNDGSKDSSLEIMKRYAANDPRIVIIDKENGGYGKAMNVGLDRATGEYIGILEPDDYVPLNMYEDLYQAAKEHDLDFVKADFYRFTTDDQTGDMHLVYNHLDSSGEWYNRVVNPSETPIVTKFIMNTWSGIYKREFIEAHHIRHNETPGASFQDNGFFWQTFMYAKSAMFINKPYYMNRRDNPNSSVNSKEKVYCMNVEYDFIRSIFMREENRELWERFKGYFNRKRYHNYLFTLGRISQEFKEPYVERISKELKRSLELNELDLEVFTENEQKKLALLIYRPKEFYQKYVVEEEKKKAAQAKPAQKSAAKPSAAEKRLREIENSTTFKVGKIVMFLPIAVKKAIKRLLGK